MTAPNVAQLEEYLAQALRRGGFEIYHIGPDRFLRPVLNGDLGELVDEVPLLSLRDAARDLERLLS